MGKKGVILDSGKTAQSSMALYWKKDKDRAKHPKQKPQEENDKQITDKSVMSNFQKWKLHKEKLITKAYNKPAQDNQANTKQAIKQKDDDDMMQQILESKKPKIITIPGFKSKQGLAQKLQIQKPKQADQSTNVLRLPSHMQGLTQEEINNILREKKRQMMNKFRHQKQQNRGQHHGTQENMLLQNQYIDLTKNKDKQTAQNLQPQKLPEPIKQPQQNFFKSQILNKIQKEGLQTIISQNLNQSKPQQKTLCNQDQNKITKDQISPVQTTMKPAITDKKFIPRALKK